MRFGTRHSGSRFFAWFGAGVAGAGPQITPTDPPDPITPMSMYDIFWPGLGAMTGIDWPGAAMPVDWPGI